MSSDLEFKVQGNLVKNQTIIKNQKMQNELEQKGYGEIDNDSYFLNMIETLFLLYSKKLKLTKGKRIIDFDDLIRCRHTNKVFSFP